MGTDEPMVRLFMQQLTKLLDNPLPGSSVWLEARDEVATRLRDHLSRCLGDDKNARGGQ